MPFKTVIFDMDGIIINSEPLWRRAEVQVFNSIGVPLNEELAWETIGTRVDEVMRHWYERYPWEGKTFTEVGEEIIDAMVALVKSDGQPMPGAHDAVALAAEVSSSMAIASSSPLRLIEATLERLDLMCAFDVIQSAEHVEFGKPHPAVYLQAAARLGADPRHCVAIEDSVVGLISAKAARMGCIAVPDVGANRSKFSLADVILDSLADLTPEMFC